MAILGYNTIGGTQPGVVAGGHYATKFTPSESGIISQISVYWVRTLDMDFRVAIYADSSGDPAAKLVESVSAVTITGTGWQDIAISYSFSAGVPLWLTAMGASDQCSLVYDAGTTHQHDQHTGTYPTWNDPWGTPFAIDRVYSIYATYTPSGSTLMGQILT